MLASLLAAALLTQAPTVKPEAPTKPRPSTSREATLRSTIEKRKQADAKKRSARAAKAAWEARRAEEWRLYVERVGPILAAQERQAWEMQMEARRTAALEAMSRAAQQEAITDQKRLQLQQQQAGLPQVFVPGQGFVTYPGAIAGPSR